MNIWAQRELDPSFEREQFVTLTRLVPILYAVVAISTLAMMASFRDTAPAWVIVWLPLILFGSSIMRMFYWRGLRAVAYEVEIERTRRIVRTTRILGPAMCMGFVFVGLMLLRGEDMVRQSFAMIGIWSAAVACAFCLFVMPLSAALILLTATLPLCLSFFMSGMQILSMMAMVLVALTALILYMLAENYRTFIEIVRSRSKLEEKRLQTEAARQEATAMALTDPLTGLPNRRYFDRRLTEELGFQTNLAVAMIDLDGFKPVNDAYGHAVGDLFLVEASRRLVSALGEEGVIARMGGDEFAALFFNTPNETAAMDRARALLAALEPPFMCGAVQARMQASAGVATRFDGSDEEPGPLVERADIALYSAKARARGTVVAFCVKLEKAARERATIEQGLRAAVQQQDFDVHFQPIVNLATRRIVGFEALARWSHPQLGPISPAVFVPIVEQAGLIEAMTECVLRKAACAAALWPDDLHLAFNLSALQIVRPLAAVRLIEILRECGLPARRFEAEVTETAIMSDVGAARATILTFKCAGARVALDDFGSGYSNFGQLRDLPLDKVKIDKSFIDPLGGDPRAEALVAAIVGMCKHLGLRCVAEGLETPAQRDFVRAIGCEEGQGYLLGRPGPAHAVDSLLTQADERAA